MDAAVLADCLVNNYDASAKSTSLRNSLLEYSIKQVPEGKALYDLSFGSKQKRLFASAAQALDFVFKGKFGLGRQPLQTLLTTSLMSFADIRRERYRRYEEAFPDSLEWEELMTALDATALPLVEKTKP